MTTWHWLAIVGLVVCVNAGLAVWEWYREQLRWEVKRIERDSEMEARRRVWQEARDCAECAAMAREYDPIGHGYRGPLMCPRHWQKALGCIPLLYPPDYSGVMRMLCFGCVIGPVLLVRRVFGRRVRRGIERRAHEIADLRAIEKLIEEART